MKKVCILTSFIVILCALVFSLCGCRYEKLGETKAEGRRRHVRNNRIDRQTLEEDLDAWFLINEPSKLTERTIP